MLYLAIALVVGYLSYLVWEKYRNDKCLASFQQVIHVNGIRGKTGTCRLIDGYLRQGGYKVFTKTTGTTPFYIDTGGVEHLIERKGPANIKEQLSMIRMAQREGAEILILECMAVNPELQRVTQRSIVKGNLNVITNVRYDHILDMGQSLDEIAESLSGTVPENGMLFTADRDYYPFLEKVCAAKHTTAVLCQPEGIEDENQRIAYELGAHLGLDRACFAQSLDRCKVDFGANALYPLGNNSRFLNLFSVNDPQSTTKMLEKYGFSSKDVIFVYNHRLDRPDRMLLFVRYFFPHQPCQKILIIGENKSFAARMLRKNGYKNVEILPKWQDLLEKHDAVMVGIGNIKGDAYALINELEKGNNNE